ETGGGLLRSMRPDNHDAERSRQRPDDLPHRRVADLSGGICDLPHRPVDGRLEDELRSLPCPRNETIRTERSNTSCRSAAPRATAAKARSSAGAPTSPAWASNCASQNA